MISKKNIDNAVETTGKKAGSSMIRILLPALGLLVSAFLLSFSGVGRPSTTAVVKIVKDSSVAGSGQADSIQVMLNPATEGDQIDFDIVIAGVSYTFEATTNSKGIAELPFASSQVGYTSVDISDVTRNTDLGSTQVYFMATPDPPDPTRSFFEVIENMSDADGVAQDQVEAFIYDDHGNLLSANVDWSVSAGANFVTSPNQTSPAPPAFGAGTTTIALTSTTAGTYDVRATATAQGKTITLTQPNNGPPYLPVSFVQPQPNPSASYIITVVSPQPADGTSRDEVQAYVVDNQGVPIVGASVTFTIPAGLTPIPSATVLTDASGFATIYYTSNTAGPFQVQAEINGVPPNLNDQSGNNYVTVVFYNPPPNTSASYITPLKTPVPADGTSTDEVEAYLVGTNGQPLNGVTVTFSVLAPGTATLQQITATTVNGVATAFLTNTNVEFDNVVATYTDPVTNITYTLNDKVNTSQPYTIVQFIAGSVDQLKSYIVVTKDNQTADGNSTDIVTAYLYDAQGHPITNATLDWTVATGASLNSSTSSGNVYTESFVSNTSGPYKVTLQVNGVTVNEQITGNSSVTIHFVSGPPVTGDPGGPGNGGNPGGGGPGNGGTPPGGGGSGPGNGGGSGPGNGGGSGPGSGGDPGTNNGYSEIYVWSQYNYRLADGQHQDSVYVYITDANKNAVSGVTVTFYIQQPGGTITSGEQWTSSQTATPITATTGPDGIARVAMTSTTPGSVWVYATIIDPTTGNPVLVAKSDVEVDFVTKPDITNIQTALTVIVGEAMADGTQQNEVKAHVIDLDGNVMPNQQVYFVIDSGTGTIVTPQPVTTDGNGDAFIQITSKTVGYVLITATVDSEKIVFGSPARVYFAMINIYVPRAFSPNNDGTNDLLKPILVGISTFHYFNVYNRWGNLIFTTQDPNQGWDGTFKGVPQPVETYLWIAEGIDENGHKVVQKGMTSLVR